MKLVDPIEGRGSSVRTVAESELPDLNHLDTCYDKRFSKEYCKKHEGRHTEQLRTLLRCVPRTMSCARVLDFGCGSGGCSALLKEYFPDSEIHGIDISNEAIKTARSRFPDCHYSVFDGATASYPDEHFDLIFSTHVLEHVLSLEKSVQDMARMVRPGGFICITLPCANERSFEWKLTMLMKGGSIASPTGETKWCWEDSTHLRRIESADLIERFEQNGLQLRQAFFGNQFWGGVENVCLSGPVMVLKWLQVSRGQGMRAKATLALAKGLLLLVSPIFLTNIDLNEKRKKFSGIKKALCLAAVPVRALYQPVRKCLKYFADIEWDKRRGSPNGASQFIVLRKA